MYFLNTYLLELLILKYTTINYQFLYPRPELARLYIPPALFQSGKELGLPGHELLASQVPFLFTNRALVKPFATLTGSAAIDEQVSKSVKIKLVLLNAEFLYYQMVKLPPSMHREILSIPRLYPK